MRIPDDFRKCLGFVLSRFTKDAVEYEKYEGTAFFISIPSETYSDLRHIYLVTAKHVIMDENDAVLPHLHLRLNTKTGGREDIQLKGEWFFHEDPDIDVAVLPFCPDLNYFDWVHCPYTPSTDDEEESDNVFADDKTIDAWEIGIGDEIRITGLFSKRTGSRRNIPIIRSGIIAAMPEEPILAKFERNGKVEGKEFNAYLIEVRSIGGLSGSPVFAVIEHFRRPRKEGEGRRLLLGVAHRFFLLGLVRGHWRYEQQDSFTSAATIRKKDIEQVNMGMALVTPIQDVLDLLYDESGRAMKHRKEMDLYETRKRIGEN